MVLARRSALDGSVNGHKRYLALCLLGGEISIVEPLVAGVEAGGPAVGEVGVRRGVGRGVGM